jgi:acyl dehydratase
MERFLVEWGHVMLFARAVGDQNPLYADPERAVAPPTFVQASAQFDDDYLLRPKPGQPWMGSGREPTSLPADAPSPLGRSGAVLHAEQHFEYHRPLRPGDVLTATVTPGQTWEKEGRRGGKLHFTETVTEYRDQDGDLVVTARMVGVGTERVPEPGR